MYCRTALPNAALAHAAPACLPPCHTQVAARTKYSGDILDMAKAVSTAAHGGQVVLSDSAWRALEADGHHRREEAQGVMVCSMGQQQLPCNSRVAQLYAVYGKHTIARTIMVGGWVVDMWVGQRSRADMHESLDHC